MTQAGRTQGGQGKDTGRIRHGDRRIFDLWLACHSRDEIADLTGASAGDVSSVTSEMANLPNLTKLQQSAAEHATDFDAPGSSFTYPASWPPSTEFHRQRITYSLTSGTPRQMRYTPLTAPTADVGTF
jgi:hypothetical protein